MDYGVELSDLKDRLIEKTFKFKNVTDTLKEKEREVIDYYASDLADMAVYLVNSWLILKDGCVSERKRELVRSYINEHLSKVEGAQQAILNAGIVSLQKRASIFSIT